MAVKGGHAVGQIQEDGLKLVFLALRLGKRVLQRLRHLVEGLGQRADFVPGGGHRDGLKISSRHAQCAFGQPLYGVCDGACQQKGQQNGNHHGDKHGLDDEQHHLPGQIPDLVLAVLDVNHIVVKRHGIVHIPLGNALLVAPFSPQSLEQVRRHLQGSAQLLIGAGQIVALPVKEIKIAVGVNPQLRGVDLDALIKGLGAALPRLVEQFEGLLVEKGLHLPQEVVVVKGGDIVDQHGSHHQHERNGQQRHDEHHLHLKTFFHGKSPPLFVQAFRQNVHQASI